MAARLVEKLHLSAHGLLTKVRKVFMDVKAPSRGAQGKPRSISIAECLMSALAIFKLKFPSLLQFEEQREEKIIKRNLKNLFQLERVPCDTYMSISHILPLSSIKPFKFFIAGIAGQVT
jgi:hypothetical protein